MDILGRNADTAWGREHGFAAIRGPEDFRRQPLVSADALAPWVDRILAGEDGVLTAERPIAFTTTSGSTGGSKTVPITPRYCREFQASMMASLWHVYRAFPRAFRGRGLYFVGRARASESQGRPIGSMSGFNYSALPRVIRSLYAFPEPLLHVIDAETRLYLGLHFAACDHVTLAGAIFPVTVVLFLRGLPRHRDALIHHIARGTLPDWLVLDPTLRKALTSAVRPRPDVAARLAAAPHEGPGLTAAALPHLHLLLCWTSATAALYLPELQAQLPEGVHIRDAVYAAAEGWCNVPLGEPTPGGPLAAHGHYFEFVPEADYTAGSTDAIGAESLREGERYAILITNSSGLYRYRLDDVIAVDGFWKGLPRIRFVRKLGAHCSLVGEKLDESHVNDAMTELLTDGPRLTWFCLAPATDRPTAYDLWVEGDASLDADALAARLDARLHARLFDWAGHRDEGALGPIRAHALPVGTYEAWRDSVAAAGGEVAQMKTAHLVEDASRIPAALRAAQA